MNVELDHAYLSEIACLEDVIAIVYEEFPEARGLFQVLLGQDECKKLLESSQARKEALEQREKELKEAR